MPAFSKCRVGECGRGANARYAAADVGKTRDHHGAHDFTFHLGAHASSVRANQGALQVAPFVERNGRCGERAKSRRESVDRIATIHEQIDRRALTRKEGENIVTQRYLFELSGYGNELRPARAHLFQ